jgi:glutamate dehydrogenase
MAEVHERYVRSLEQAGVLSRDLEALPSIEAFEERARAGGGLTAPEFAILLSHTKIALSRALLASDLPDDPYLATELALYFPTRLRERFPDQLQRHSLRREIVATRIANDVVNRAGTTFVFRLGDETGAAPDEIARAYIAAREIAGLRTLWAGIEALDGRVPAATQTAMLLRSRILLERTTRWLLRHRRRPLDVAETVARYAPGFAAVAEELPSLLGASALEEATVRARALTDVDVPAELAGHMSRLLSLVPAPDMVEIAAVSGLDVTSVAEAYFALGERLELQWLRDRIVSLPRDTRWAAMARAALRDDVYAEQAGLTKHVVRSGTNGQAARGLVESWLAQNASAVERSRQVLADIRTGGALDLARLSVAVRELRNLIQASGATQQAAEAAAAPPAG